MHRMLSCCVLWAACFIFVGCGESSPSKTTGEIERELVPEATFTKQETQQFATDLEQAVNEGDMNRLNSTLFNWDLCFDLMMAGIDISEKDLADARRGFLSTVHQQNGLFHEVQAAIQQGGSFTLIRTREVDGQPRALFRLVIPNGGLNYHEYLLTKNDAGTVQAYDVFVYLSGERLSQTMRRMMLQLAAHQNRGLLDRMTGREQTLVKHFDEVQQVIAQLRSRNPAGALAAYDRLPQELRKQKFLLLLGLRGAQESGNDARYQEILETFRTEYPTDAAVDFISIDYFVMQKDFEKALAAVDRVDQSLGGDAYLGISRAGIYVENKQYDLARQALDKAIAADPNLEEAYWTQVGIALQQNNNAEILKWLKAIDQQFDGADFAHIQFDPNYAAFRRSPQYREWQSHQRSR